MGNAHVKPHPRTKNKKQVHWKAAARPPAPGKPQLVPETESTPDVVSVRWTRPATDGGSPITGYLLEHRRTGSPHWVRATPLMVQSTETTLSGLEPGWRYQFRVCAENAVGISDPSELSEPITVTLQRSAITAPRFTQELKETTALENEKAEFVVHFLGQPPPRVCWYKDAFEIFSSRRIRIATESDRSVLTFHQCSLSDEGEIKCTATNRAGHVASKAKLTVEAPPTVRLPRQYEDGLLFEIGEMIRLKVSVAGRPTPLVFWSHNGESIKSDDRYEIEEIDKSSVLKINEAIREDRGEYHIRAVNKLGEDLQTFLVTVTDKPSPPGKARVVMALGKSVTLSWSRPDDDGGSKIGNYIVEYYRLGWNVWLKAATSRQLTTMLGDLIEGSEYKFRIKAESPYGVSEPSEESDIVFVPDPKRGILQPPPHRARSQPREVPQEPGTPAVTRRKNKPRSQSSSRVEPNGPNLEPPLPPKRTKIKSPTRTPEPSPKVTKKPIDPNINREIFDESVARELSYGSPDMRVKKEMENLETKIITNGVSKPRTPSPAADNHTVIKVKIEPPKEPGPVKAKSLSPEVEKRKLYRDNSENMTGSSEFMLVLYPGKNDKGQSYYDSDEDAVPPPMSLSAPELGAESPIFNQLKTSASSTELLHERAMMRLYQAALEDETESENRKISATTRRVSIPKIQINSKDNETIIGLDRNESLRRRRLSGGGGQQKVITAQRRFSLKTSTESKEEVQKLPQTAEEKRVNYTNRQRSESEEMEEQAFEAVRKRMDGRRQDKKRAIAVADADNWDDDYESSTDEDDDELEESSTEDERREETVRFKPRYNPDDDDDEEEPYHPGPIRTQLLNNKEPFEILTVRKDPPSPDFVPKPILKKTEHEENLHMITASPPPSPSRRRASSPAPPGMFQRERSASLVEPAQKVPENLKSLFDHAQPPPPPPGPRKRSFSLIPQRDLLTKTVELPEIIAKAEPTRPFSILSCISEVAKISGITAASVVIPDTLLQKQKDAEEAKVVADHYGDIVRSYGGRRRSSTQIFMDRDALKRAAEKSEETDEEIIENRETETVPIKNSYMEQYDNVPRKDSLTTKDGAIEGTSGVGNDDKKVVENNTNVMSHSSQPHQVDKKVTQPQPPYTAPKNLNTSSRESLSPARSSPSRSPTLSRRSPIKSQNWDRKPNEPKRLPSASPKHRTLPRKTSPSPLRKSKRASPSPLRQQIVKRDYPTRRPVLREIMTQTSGELFDSSDVSRTSSPSQDEELARAEVKVRGFVDYVTDLTMLAVACWLYFFKNELYAIPVLLVMVYRQLKEEVSKRIPKWLLRRLNKKKDVSTK